ncbi:hypothetical protein LOTGIDRAFT_173571 [Lottia gigantea]|uniref:Uncharacterized protein n=1 Tax=Lottia gigantea TaxID=225164 RepID=V4A723_LOTGI|nr:hypothetical protein LOTGIDRAFT_173571 [Lottia gigantea]ESO99733.1 hypothetical protein LOTGIDRAFT_173571 [Lottia gigantea]
MSCIFEKYSKQMHRNIFYLVLIQVFQLVQSAAISENVESELMSDSQLVVLGILSVVVIVCVSVYIIFTCGDCYNSEVSSENHPACASGSHSGAHKWGGSDMGYASNTYGQAIDINNQAPAYSMIPVQVNDDPGFQGYSTGSASGPGAHYNPVQDSQEPPPAYSDIR